MRITWSFILVFLAIAFKSSFAQVDLKSKVDGAQEILSQRDEVFFKFKLTDRYLIDSLTKVISLDSYNPATGEYFAYANTLEFKQFLGFDISFDVLKTPSLVDFNVKMVSPDEIIAKGFTDTWDSYPTYEAYVDLMYQFQSDFPELCKIHNIGTLPSGRSLLFAQISANVNQKEAEPRFMYTSTIHGDETTGFVLMLRLIHYLLNGYEANPDIAYLLDNMDIWICPNENPDGTYYAGNHTVTGARRYNANGYDLNRNYPNPVSTSSSRQFETLAMMGLTDSLKFVMSANMHGGTEVVNYPWDSWTSSVRKHADHYWWKFVSHEYADTARFYSPSTYMTGFDLGITHGGDWYVVYGSRQDYMCYYKSGREVTLEISDTKLLPSSLLPDYWGYLYRSYLNYLRQALYGLRGIVTNGLSGDPIEVRVDVLNYDKDNSHIYSLMPNGNYHRPLLQGIYDVKFSKDGFTTKTISGIQISNYSTEVVDVELFPLTSVSPPSNLNTLVVGFDSITLSWDAPVIVDPVEIGHYLVFRNGELLTTTNNLSFTDPDLSPGHYSYSVAAVYTNPEWQSEVSNTSDVNLEYFTISATAGDNGSISPSGLIYYHPGENQIFGIAANENHHIHNVLVDGVSVGAPDNFQFTNIESNHTIHALFALDSFSVTALPNNLDYGQVLGSGLYPMGTTVTLTAIPFDNYHFVKWLENDETISTDSIISFTASTNRTIIALFAKDTYIISAVANGNGTISPSGDVVVEHGNDIAFTITPLQGSYISSVAIDGSGIGSPEVYTFYNVTKNHSIIAEFVDIQPVYHQITVEYNQGGEVSPSGIFSVTDGESITFTIEPNDYYFIADVLLDEQSVFEDVEILPSGDGSYTLNNISNSHSLYVSFEIVKYTINSSAGEHGTILPDGTTLIEHGGSQTYSITPDANCHIADVIVDGETVGPIAEFAFDDVTSDHTIEALFALDTYVITAVAGENGSISPLGEVVVNHGESQTFGISPNDNYLVDYVLVDGIDVGAVLEYTFSDISSDHSIEAYFKIRTYTITATCGSNGTISPLGISTVSHGENLQFSITPNTGYHVTSVMVDENEIGATTSYLFENIVDNHTIHAEFSINTYTISATSGENGSINPTGEITLNHGESQTFLIQADDGFHIDDVVVNGESLGSITEYTFAYVDANGTIHADFKANMYTLTVTVDGNGIVEVDETVFSEPLLFEYGSSVFLTAIPDNGWKFTEWSEDISGNENPFALVINSNKLVKATFSPLVNDDDDLLGEIVVFPNPFSESLTLSNVSDVRSIQIVNLIGKTLRSYEPLGLSEFAINTSDLEAGIYFLVIMDSNGKDSVKKVVKMP